LQKVGQVRVKEAFVSVMNAVPGPALTQNVAVPPETVTVLPLHETVTLPCV
jgi:hypothetical protein